MPTDDAEALALLAERERLGVVRGHEPEPVSYTHLTLPTIYSV